MTAAGALAFERLLSQPAPPSNAAQSPAVVVVLHGNTGDSAQLRPFAQELIDRAAAAAGCPVAALVVNQRGHGASKGLPLPPPHTVEASAEDVLELLRRELGPNAAPAAILGHSIGAKVALTLAARLAEGGGPLPKQVWLLDSPAGPVSLPLFAVLRSALVALSQLQQPVESIEVVKQTVASLGVPEDMQAYFASRCAPDPAAPGKSTFIYDPATAVALLDSYCTQDCRCLLDSPPPGLQVHSVRGADTFIFESSPEEAAAFDKWLAEKQASADTGATHAGGSAPVQYWELAIPGAAHFFPFSYPTELAALVAPTLAAALVP